MGMKDKGTDKTVQLYFSFYFILFLAVLIFGEITWHFDSRVFVDWLIII
jgi:hypothetical protein